MTSRCQGVRLPAFTSMQPLFTTTVSGVPTTVTGSPSATGASTGGNTAHHGLSGGQIAGIVVGSVLGALLLLALLIFACLALRKRRNENDEKSAMAARRSPSPPPQRPAPPAMYTRSQGRPPGGGRVVGMTALEGISGSSPLTGTTPSTNNHSSPESFTYPGTTGAAGIAAIPTRRERSPQRRQRSPDRSYDGHSPTPNPEGAEDNSPYGSQQSEQMDSFKDYYSSEEIFPGDLVSVLWAYSPRAEDEFELERGQMLRIVGIWDDGWATAVRVDQTAEEWEAQNIGRPPPSQRDSVVGGMAESGEVRAFPVCFSHVFALSM